MTDENLEVYEATYEWVLPRDRSLDQVYTTEYFSPKNSDKIFFSMSIVRSSNNSIRNNLKIFKKGIFKPRTTSITIQYHTSSGEFGSVIIANSWTKVIRNWENNDYVSTQYMLYSNIYLTSISCNILIYDVDYHCILSEASKTSMDRYLLSKEYSDVTIKVKDDGEELSAHKLVLASHSCVFERMFNTDMKEAKENCICFGEFDMVTIKGVLQFMYTGKIVRDDDVDLLFKILACAKMFQIEKLQIYCEHRLAVNLNVNNIIKILSIIDNLEMPKLSENAKLYLEMNNDHISFVDALKEVNNSKILFEFLANKSGMKMVNKCVE